MVAGQISLNELQHGLELALKRARFRIILSGIGDTPREALVAGQADFFDAAQNLAAFRCAFGELPGRRPSARSVPDVPDLRDQSH